MYINEFRLAFILLGMYFIIKLIKSFFVLYLEQAKDNKNEKFEEKTEKAKIIDKQTAYNNSVKTNIYIFETNDKKRLEFETIGKEAFIINDQGTIIYKGSKLLKFKRDN